MRFRKKIIVFAGAASLIILTAIACSKSDHGPLGHSKCPDGTTNTPVTDPDLLALRFKEGSWWLLQDSMNTSFQDTLFIQYVTSGQASPHEYSCAYNDQYTMYMWCRYMPEHYDRVFYYNPWKFATSATQLMSSEAYMELPKTAANNPCVFYDSVYVKNKWYKNVIKSDTVRYVFQSVSYKMICYFNSTDGFLRNDIFDQNNQLTSKKWLLANHVVKQ